MNAFRKDRYFIKVLFGCSLAHIIHPELLFFWVHPLFCIKLRGQHLYLAVAERSSSHPKTNKYWGLVWLFLALITNYIWLYSWNWVKNLLRPIWTHFSHPQSRILSPFFTVARYLEVISEVGLFESAKNETFWLLWPRRGCPRVKMKLELDLLSLKI